MKQVFHTNHSKNIQQGTQIDWAQEPVIRVTEVTISIFYWGLKTKGSYLRGSYT